MASLPAQDLDSSRALQQEEWEVLESIYPDYLSGDLSKETIRLEIPVELSEPTKLGFANDSPNRTLVSDSPLLSSLPPLLLDICLPPSYPLSSAPRILSIYASHSWLPGSFRLQELLMDMWVPGEGVLFSWIEYIRSSEFLSSLGLASYQDGGKLIRIPQPELAQQMGHLIAYDTFTQQLRFSQTSYNCKICLTSIKGARCILLSCSHVFCRGCLEDFWKLCIAEGDVSRVGCPDPHCVKEGREANEEEVRRVVNEEEVQRWKWLRQKRSWERDPTIIHCPLPFCQAPVPKPAEEESGWDRLRTCPSCSYSFCSFCKHSWHGPLSECPIRLEDSFIKEYMALPEGSFEKLIIERRYGLPNIRRLVAKLKEDRANQEWVKNETTSCPSCRVYVQKSAGCNHMTCSKCQTHFCYRCGQKLDGADPYKHFSIHGQPCYAKLFDFRSGEEDEWQPIEGFDAL